MEEKKKWNLGVYESIGKEIDRIALDEHRGEKGIVCSAALLAFSLMGDEERRAWVDLVKLAEGRGYQGTVLDAAREIAAEGIPSLAGRFSLALHRGNERRIAARQSPPAGGRSSPPKR